MLKRKFQIFSLSFLLLISITGLPIAYHICFMMQSISLQSCGMCQNASTKCCKDEVDGKEILSSTKDNCCSVKFVANPIEEKYLTSSTEKQKLEIKNNYFATIVDNIAFKIEILKHFYIDKSPPKITSNTLYLSNSILLI